MSKGSVRQKGRNWYYRFYVENEQGIRIQKEFAGGKNKRETEAMLRKAMEDYESRHFIASPGHMKLADLLDLWIEEELKASGKSNGTVMLYCATAERIKQSPISQKRLKAITAEHLQQYVDMLSFGGTDGSGKTHNPLAASSIRAYMAVLQGAFRFAVFPKRLLTDNPMQYVIRHEKTKSHALFEHEMSSAFATLSHEQYKCLCRYLEGQALLLPIQIAYYTGLRVGEICALVWEDIHMDEQYLLVQRSLRYDSSTHHTEIGPTKGRKVRTVDFGHTLKGILQTARQKSLQHGTSNYYKITSEKGRQHYEVYHLSTSESVTADYTPLSFVCTRQNGTCFTPDYIGHQCRLISKKLDGFEGFHFHMLRHTFTSNLLSHGASPKDVQELLGHSDIHLTMNIYAHADRNSKRLSVQSLDYITDQPEGKNEGNSSSTHTNTSTQ